MTHEWNQFEDRLDAYVDNLLAGEDRARFESEIAGNAQAATMVRRSREVNGLLRRTFDPSPPPTWVTSRSYLDVAHRNNGRTALVEEPIQRQAIAAAPAQTTTEHTYRINWARRFAVAAAIILAGVGAWLIWQNVRPAPTSGYAAGEWRSFDQAYAELTKPAWVCDSDTEFEGVFAGRFNQPLLFKEPPGEPTMAGLAYCHTITRDTVCMVGSADANTRVLVLIDRLERDNHPTLDASAGLHLFRRELGKLVLYEISPKDHPTLLEWFYIPDGG